MSPRLGALAFLFLAVPSFAAGPAEAVAAAWGDAKRLPPGEALQTRWLSLHAVPQEYRQELRRAVSFWANSLSREAIIVKPRDVTADLLAVRLIDYGWDSKVWEKLGQSEPYFTVRVTKQWPGGIWRIQDGGDGRHYAAGPYTSTATAPWLEPASAAELVGLTGSVVPVVRADWWISQVAVQADRKAGYYDFLGVGKKRGDFEKLVGLDRALSQRLRKEIAAIVPASIVALHNRQIYRFQTVAGSYWETRDSKQNTDKNNAIRLLNGDYQHDAEEIYAALPNGLFGFFLSDAGGNRVDSAPDNIASDGRSAGSDRRVHVGLSCVRCHVEGIRPIDCWARRAYAAPDGLAVIDPVRAVRLRQLYLSDLDRLIRRDQADYADALRAANGLTPGDNAKLTAAVWDRYIEQPLGLEDVARELGISPDALQARFKATQGLDPILFGLLKQPPLLVRREHWEEVFSLAMGLMK